MGCVHNKGRHPLKTEKRIQQMVVKPGMFIQETGDFFDQEYDLGEKLGAGAFSAVYKCVEKLTGETKAVKIVSKQALTKQHTTLKNKLQEIQVLKLLDHPNILKIFKGFEDARNFYIVMEFCQGGELFREILTKHYFTEIEAASIMSQLFSAVSYCHSKKVIHRDLKPENLLIESSEKGLMIKVGDFGNSLIYDVKTKISGVFGSLYYIAPEVLENKYDEKCDEWSCGIILFMLLVGKPPFIGKTDREIIHSIKYGILITEGPPFAKISREAKGLIHKLLDRNPLTRISATEALADPWFRRFLKQENPSEMVLASVLTNLSSFTNTVKLKSAIFTYIATQCVSQKDIRELTNAFKLLDKNGDGKVSKEELLVVYKDIAGSVNAEKDVDNIMRNVDTDGSGFIDYTEFIQASLNKEIMFSKANLEKAFSLFDKDKNGNITAEEIAEIFSSGELGEDNMWKGILKQVDINGDGLIDLKEFHSILLDKCTEMINE